MMRTLRTNNWPSLIPAALNQLNSRQLKKLHGLSPKDFNSPLDDVKLNTNLETQGGIEEARSNQKAYEENSKELQVGDMVYADKKKASTFTKSFAPKV